MSGDPGGRVLVARRADLPPGTTRKFSLRLHGVEEECFLVNHDGQIHAWVNRCQHIPIGLDWVENQFLSEDRRFLVCATHGARFLPDTGECIAGPPCGKFLARVELEIEGDEIHALGHPG